MSAQGRCKACRIRWTWPENPAALLSDARCPDCGRALKRTTHLTKDERRHFHTMPRAKKPEPRP